MFDTGDERMKIFGMIRVQILFKSNMKVAKSVKQVSLITTDYRNQKATASQILIKHIISCGIKLLDNQAK